MSERQHQAESRLINWLGHACAGLGAAITPRAQPSVRNLSYGPDPAQQMDLWKPESSGPHPVALFVHGGAFRVMSKDTHWMMAQRLSAMGFLTASINYRLAPKHPYPAAPQDVLAAWMWLHQHIAAHGGDMHRAIVCGDSAGANLAAGLLLSTCWQRTESWAEQAHALTKPPQMMLGLYGIYQVSDAQRYSHERHHPWAFRHRVKSVERDYFGDAPHRHCPGRDDLADPLLFLERTTTPPTRPLPPVLLVVGDRDPLLADSNRLHRALQQWHVPVCEHIYPSQRHGFASLWWTASTERLWSDVAEFVARHRPWPTTEVP